MSPSEWLVLAVVLGLFAAALSLWPRLRRRRHGARIARARQLFHRRREWLEARFVTLASQSGRPRGLHWANCDFDDRFAIARDRSSGQLRALVGVTIRFEAIEAGGMEDVEAVANLRSATAVFHFDQDAWTTDGRAVFNLSPDQTIKRFHHELETMD